MKIDGDEYRKDTGFVHKIDEDDIPQVGQISHIYVVNGKTVVFKAQRFNSFYHSHFRCYCLRQVDEEPFSMTNSSLKNPYTFVNHVFCQVIMLSYCHIVLFVTSVGF